MTHFDNDNKTTSYKKAGSLAKQMGNNNNFNQFAQTLSWLSAMNWTAKSLLAALTLTVMACSNSNTPASNTESKATEGETATVAAEGVTPITFWHSMSGELGETLDGIVADFNAANPEYKITAIYKGAYDESMNAGIAAFRAKQAPDILQVYEVGTATMMNAGDAIKPIQELSEEVGDPIDASQFVGAVAGYYSSMDGKLISMPFNSSTPVLYYNKDMYAKAGLPDRAPSTYNELKSDASALKKAGFCGYTTAWPTWVLVENFAAWHNIPFASKDNGFGGLDARLQLTQPLYKRLFSDLATMSKDGTFTYGGRGDAANTLFMSGKCGIFTGSSGSRAQVLKDGKFKFGIGKLPYYEDVAGAPQNSIIGGASLWVFNGKDANVYKGITKFFHHLSTPEVAATWHQKTGYVPVVKAGYDLTKSQGYYDKNPGTDIAVQSLSADTTAQSRGVRLGNLPEIREMEEGYMEQIFNGSMTVDVALAAMEDDGNKVLEQFESDNKK
ncbi:MAG: sn-glycerol-3-phosphate ABC transporter substrate-binding protein UgpB [Psychrobacter sp.]|nr:sn-glycerol-3-phosphate ABC transporter substrate-binding protein UgpB [Psychrobacter sp.]